MKMSMLLQECIKDVEREMKEANKRKDYRLASLKKKQLKNLVELLILQKNKELKREKQKVWKRGINHD